MQKVKMPNKSKRRRQQEMSTPKNTAGNQASLKQDKKKQSQAVTDIAHAEDLLHSKVESTEQGMSTEHESNDEAENLMQETTKNVEKLSFESNRTEVNECPSSMKYENTGKVQWKFNPKQRKKSWNRSNADINSEVTVENATGTWHVENIDKSSEEPKNAFNYLMSNSVLKKEHKKFQESNSTIKVGKLVEKNGDLFCMSEEYSLGHCVAADLVMGAGIALTFRRTYNNIEELRRQHQGPGGLAVWKSNNRFIYYLVTKESSTCKPTSLNIWKSLQKMKQHIISNNVKKLALPKIACGLDGFNWDYIKRMLEYVFQDVDIELCICSINHNLTENKSSENRNLFVVKKSDEPDGWDSDAIVDNGELSRVSQVLTDPSDSKPSNSQHSGRNLSKQRHNTNELEENKPQHEESCDDKFKSTDKTSSSKQRCNNKKGKKQPQRQESFDGKSNSRDNRRQNEKSKSKHEDKNSSKEKHEAYKCKQVENQTHDPKTDDDRTKLKNNRHSSEQKHDTNVRGQGEYLLQDQESVNHMAKPRYRSLSKHRHNAEVDWWDKSDEDQEELKSTDTKDTNNDLSTSSRQKCDVGKRNKSPSQTQKNTENLLKSNYATSDKEFNRQRSDEEFFNFEPVMRENKNFDFKKVIEVQGDLFAMPEEYALGHCVAEDMNMGSGIAVQFRQQFKRVDELLEQKQRQSGLAMLNIKGRYIYYLVTKKTSNGKPTYLTLWTSLQKMKKHIIENKVKKLALPRIGCGLDGLEWSWVKKMLEHIFEDVDVEIKICNFQQAADSPAPQKPTRSTTVVNYPIPITELESWSIIIYLGSEDGFVTDEINELDKKFGILRAYKNAVRRVGEPIRTDKFAEHYIIYGFIVKKRMNDTLSFVHFQKCLNLVQKSNRKDEYEYVGLQAFKDIEDTRMMMSKLVNLMRNSLTHVEICICWPPALHAYMP